MSAISTIDAIYRHFLKRYLFGRDAEYAHRTMLRMLAATPAFPAPPDAPSLEPTCGIDFPNPIGLAAGMDKDAVAVHGWETLGFGFAELGTITPRPQPGMKYRGYGRCPNVAR